MPDFTDIASEAPQAPETAARSPDGPTWDSDRSRRFLARVDRHLAAVSDRKTRELFLRGQLAGWERAYARFRCQHGPDFELAEGTDSITASDFLLTITGLRMRLEFQREGE